MIRLRTAKWQFSIFFFLISTVAGLAQSSAYSRPMTLVRMVQAADRIVHGHVVSAQVQKHPQLDNLDMIVVTLSVSESLKGSPSKTLTFRQYVWDLRDRKNVLGYAKGREFLILLNRPSEYGLTSPVGVEQGRMRIMRDRSGKAYAVNGTENATLLRNLEADAKNAGVKLPQIMLDRSRAGRSGPLPLDELKETIRSLAGVAR